ncbi:MAG: hypothetical protein MZV63_48105 [Marinilabiliales bacterium]|nr:hypothetical protein [Marinilabiliales bacterium]
MCGSIHSILLKHIRGAARRRPDAVRHQPRQPGKVQEDKNIDRYSIFYGKEYIYVR